MDNVFRQFRQMAVLRLKEQERKGEAKQALRDAIVHIDGLLSDLKNPNYPRGDLYSQAVRIMIELGEGGAFGEKPENERSQARKRWPGNPFAP